MPESTTPAATRPAAGHVLFVAGTNTEIGKTVASAAIIACLREAGLRVAYVKPCQTGLLPGQPGSDADEIRRLAGEVPVHEFVRLPDPLAPAAAARVAGVAVPTVAQHAERIADLARGGDVDVVLVEGAGGLLVRCDEQGGTQAELAKEVAATGLPVSFVVVADPMLGTLNLCALTQEALDARGLPCDGYVFGSWPIGDDELVLQQNLIDLPEITGRPLLGRIPSGAGRLTEDMFATEAQQWLPGLATAVGRGAGPQAGA